MLFRSRLPSQYSLDCSFITLRTSHHPRHFATATCLEQQLSPNPYPERNTLLDYIKHLNGRGGVLIPIQPNSGGLHWPLIVSLALKRICPGKPASPFELLSSFYHSSLPLSGIITTLPSSQSFESTASPILRFEYHYLFHTNTRIFQPSLLIASTESF